MKTAMFIIKFLLLGALFIVSNEDLALKEKDNFNEFTGLYSDWLGSLFEHGKDLTGYIVKVDWLPKTENSPQRDVDNRG
ncbi:MAG: hypothetical protein IIA87_05670 [Nanoarchaeota archaeon]|nr:hypothetical protein [Nanoarchaeota archaeon]